MTGLLNLYLGFLIESKNVVGNLENETYSSFCLVEITFGKFFNADVRRLLRNLTTVYIDNEDYVFPDATFVGTAF